jgi:branched-subunit amino acid ABC-type transport system permease component
MLFLALVIVAGLGIWAIRPIHRYLKQMLPTLTWLAWLVTGLVLLLFLYFLVPLVGSLLTSLVNNLFPLAAETAATSEITTTSEVATPVSRLQFVVVTASILMMIALYYFVQFTKIGKAMRAVAEDKDVAALMGVDVDRVIAITFALGAMLAGAAGVLYGLIFRQVHFFMGFLPGLKAFTAAVLGGIGNIPGAMLGGFFLGIFESLGPSLFLEGLGIPAPYQLKDVIAFTMLVLVLIFRPTGIMGVELGKKKA